MIRIAVLERDRCRSDDCGKICIKFCPMVRSRVDAVKIESGEEKPTIYESLCTGCGICVRKCPFKAISIVNLPTELEEDCSHRFGKNTFKLYRLPLPKPGTVTGLIGKNGIGKSTALKILAGEIRPNLGEYESAPSWTDIIKHYRGSVLQEYFTELSEKRLRVVHKPQYIDNIPKVVSGKVDELLGKNDERGKSREVVERLQLEAVKNRSIKDLSGGELQRLAIAVSFCKEADVYLIDEPSSYLDVKQRIEAAKLIRDLRFEDKSIIVVEHDITILDYLSDNVSILYGVPAVYGIITHPQGVRTGINTYLGGYIPDENVRFRDSPIRFHVKPPTSTWGIGDALFVWKSMMKTYEGFRLEAEGGHLHKGEIIGILGPNGIGKTTFVRLLSGLEKTDDGFLARVDVSYKPQYISNESDDTVELLLKSIVKSAFTSSSYRSEIIKPLSLDRILDRPVNELSGGELQKVAIAACLSRNSDVYLLDEPSAFLDVEERLAMARTIRRVIESRGATALVVEHDVATQDFIADRIMVFEGTPSIHGRATSPITMREGMNAFLKAMEITFRRDTLTRRPRVNKKGSRLDRYQKEIGEYYYVSSSKD